MGNSGANGFGAKWALGQGRGQNGLGQLGAQSLIGKMSLGLPNLTNLTVGLCGDDRIGTSYLKSSGTIIRLSGD